MAVSGTRIETKRAIKYLAVIINRRLNFKEHVKFIGEMASVTQIALTRMMPDLEHQIHLGGEY